MRNLFIGALFGAAVSVVAQFYWQSSTKTEISNSQRAAPATIDSAPSISSLAAAEPSLSETQLRKIVQEEIRLAVTDEFAGIRKELRANKSTGLTAKHHNSAEVSAMEASTETFEGNPMYLAVSDIVDTATAEGYFSRESLADLKTHYAELSDAQKFQIDAKLADSINNGSLEFDESLFITLP